MRARPFRWRFGEIHQSGAPIAFYTLMGLVRMTPLTPEDVIRRENLKEARVTVVDKPRDLVIGFAHAFMMPLVQPQRVRVEGNR